MRFLPPGLRARRPQRQGARGVDAGIVRAARLTIRLFLLAMNPETESNSCETSSFR